MPLMFAPVFTIIRYVMYNVQVIAAAFCCRGKSMLARAEMRVVFVPGEKISQGSKLVLVDGRENV